MKEWINVAKGIAITLVVFTHAVSDFQKLPSFEMYGRTAEIFIFFQSGFAPLRLPLFFAISGALAINTLRADWKTIFLKKIWFFYYLFALWSIIKVASGNLINGHELDWLRMLRSISYAPEMPWYLLALAVYFPISKCLLKFPTLAMSIALAATLLSWNFSEFFIGFGMMKSVVSYFLFFHLGVLISNKLLSANEWVRPWHSIILIPIVILPYLMYGLDNGFEQHVAKLAASIAATIVGAALAIFIARFTPSISKILDYIGRNTLPIYVLHIIFIRFWYRIMEDLILPNGWRWFPYPFVVSIGAIILSLIIFHVTKKSLPLLWTAPASSVAVEKKLSDDNRIPRHQIR